MAPSVLLALVLSGAPVDAGAPQRARRALRLSARAEAAADDGRTADVLRLTDRALTADPELVRAHFLRGMAFFRVATGANTPPALRKPATERFLQHLTQVAALDPDGDLGAIARTTLADLNATTLVPTTQVPCNPAAERAFADAEERFSAHAFSDAAALYRQAVEACPANATYRAWLGDAYFALGDLRTAKVHLEMAVEIDPCHAMAQRFLADMHLQQGNPRPAWRALTVAVACDPGYEPARTWLDGLVSELYGFPAELDRQLPPAEVTAGGGTVRDPRASADPTVFSPALADAFVAGLSAVPDADEPASSVLARNRAALEAALTVYGNLDARERPSSLFWPRMAAAQQHGCLDAALFAFLLTPRLVPAFLDARDHDRDALVRCMQDVLAPLPGQGILAD